MRPQRLRAATVGRTAAVAVWRTWLREYVLVVKADATTKGIFGSTTYIIGNINEGAAKERLVEPPERGGEPHCEVGGAFEIGGIE